MAEKLELEIFLDNGQLKVAAKGSTKAIQGIGDSTEKANKKVKPAAAGIQKSFLSLGKVMKGLLGLGIIKLFIDMGKAAIGGAAKLEQQTTAFTTMLKSGEKAKKLLGELRDFAASTPFQFDEIADAGKKLLAFGEAAEDIPDTLRRVGDVASGLGIPLGELSEIYGKIKVQNTVYAEDLNQLAGRGIGVFQGLADVMGVNKEEIKKMASEGKIGFTEIEQMFKNMTEAGGTFAGGMEKQSKTLAGLWSTLKDTFSNLLVTVGTDSLPAFKNLITAFSGAGTSSSVFAKLITGLGWTLSKLVNTIAFTVESLNLLSFAFDDNAANAELLSGARKELEKTNKEIKKAGKGTVRYNDLLNKQQVLQFQIGKLASDPKIVKASETYERSLNNIQDSLDGILGRQKEIEDSAVDAAEAQKEAFKSLDKTSPTKPTAGKSAAPEKQEVDPALAREEAASERRKKDIESFENNLNQKNELLQEYYGYQYSAAEMQQIYDREKEDAAVDAHHQALRKKLKLDSKYFSGLQQMQNAANIFMSTQNKGLFRFGQAISLANAGINTAEAVTKAYATVPFPANFVVAGVVGAAGLIQMGQIAAMQPPPPPPPGQKSNVIPGLATGTMEVPETAPYLLHEKEMVIPKPFAEGMRNEMKSGGSQTANINLENTINIPVNLDGEQIANITDTIRQRKAFDMGTKDYKQDSEY